RRRPPVRTAAGGASGPGCSVRDGAASRPRRGQARTASGEGRPGTILASEGPAQRAEGARPARYDVPAARATVGWSPVPPPGVTCEGNPLMNALALLVMTACPVGAGPVVLVQSPVGSPAAYPAGSYPTGPSWNGDSGCCPAPCGGDCCGTN